MDTDAKREHPALAGLTLAALGVVYGDIGTSPLYAVKETFSPSHGIPLTRLTVLGGLSTIFWSLMLVVSLKYVALIMRADNRGEGGTMALLALASSSVKGSPKLNRLILVVGACGAALFFGDAVLTPAISVLSAVEGIAVRAPHLGSYVPPIAAGVLVGLFSVQRHGTGAVGAVFGPITALWFLSLAAIGVHGIVRHPGVLAALDPFYALAFLTEHGLASFVVLGAVLLAFTGAEALYADMGHFGRRPIRIAWFGLVLPSLMLNYLGQGALLIESPAAVHHPFYLLCPGWALFPMIVLATAATVIASQATISGAYSVTNQAIQLGFLPRMNVAQTSAREIGQIYLPAVNWTLLAATLAAVVGFRSSSGLASAYGVAVTGTMMIDTFLAFFVFRFGWRYPLAACLAATAFFLGIDGAFFSASLAKVLEGGWFPVLIAAAVLLVMLTWRRGRELVMEHLRSGGTALVPFLEQLLLNPPPRVPGTAVFLVANPDTVPHALLHNLAHNKVLHERVVVVTVIIENVPWLPFGERVAVEPLAKDSYRVVVRLGFKNRIDIPQALALCREHGLEIDLMQTSFFISRETLIPVRETGLPLWRARLFAAMARNAGSVADYFNLPPNRVIELGTQIEV